MDKMTPKLRLALIAVVLLASTAYAVLIRADPSVASAVAVGYVAFLVSIITLIQIWRKG